MCQLSLKHVLAWREEVRITPAHWGSVKKREEGPRTVNRNQYHVCVLGNSKMSTLNYAFIALIIEDKANLIKSI